MKPTLKCLLILTLVSVSGHSNESNVTKESNRTKEALKRAIEKEKTFEKEQRFYQEDEYDFKDAQVDPDALDKVPVLEPDYDFDMSTGVYD